MASMVAVTGLPPSVGLHGTLASRRHALLATFPANLAQDVAAKSHLEAVLLQTKPSTRRVLQQAVSDAASLSQTDVEKFESDEDEVLPTPVVIIDQESDPDATVVELSFGNRLGALLDTMQALKELGLNVERSRITVEGPMTRKRFAITRADNGRKIQDPELLEAIRLTIINNMIEYHPESSSLLAMGNAFGIQAPTKVLKRKDDCIYWTPLQAKHTSEEDQESMLSLGSLRARKLSEGKGEFMEGDDEG